MSFSGTILEYALIPLTVTGAGGSITYGSIKTIGNKISRSVVDPNSKQNKNIVGIEHDQTKEVKSKRKKKFNIEQKFEEVATISEEITRSPLKINHGKKPNKKTSTISYVLEPSGEGWTEEMIVKRRLKGKSYEVKIWKKSDGSECRFSWNWKTKKRKNKSAETKDLDIALNTYHCCKKSGIETKGKKKKN